MDNLIFFSFVSYFLGSIPSAFFLGKLNGIDIRKIGSESTTSTNLSRALGWRWALISGILDALKAMAIVSLAIKNFSGYELVLISLMPLLGNTLPFYLKFKGGKGGATFFGIVAGLADFQYLVTRLLFFVFLVKVFKRTSVANLLFVWIMTALLYLDFGYYYGIIGLGSALLISFALRKNIKRLLGKTEPETKLKW
ncbi:MAG: glycerol-3-phosphate acyltransferase [Patescibacteria group bacterium]